MSPEELKEKYDIFSQGRLDSLEWVEVFALYTKLSAQTSIAFHALTEAPNVVTLDAAREAEAQFVLAKRRMQEVFSIISGEIAPKLTEVTRILNEGRTALPGT